MRFNPFKRDRTPGLVELANAPVGAPTSIEGTRGFIRGTLLCSEDGDRWIEHLVQEGDGALYWVAIENRRTTVAIRWDEGDEHAVVGGPGDREVTYDGVRYRRSESGTVAFTSKGDVDVAASGTLDYVDYEGTDGSLLSFERYGEAGAGRRSRVVAGTCPSCGAPLEGSSTMRCASCGSELTVEHGRWGGWEVTVGRDVTASARLQ